MAEEAMSGKTLTLTEFLLARITEDEEVARAGWTRGAGMDNLPQGWGSGPTAELVAYNAQFSPSRIAAECEAKRRIVEDFTVLHADYQATHSESLEHRRFQAAISMAHLASVYAAHLDYDESWRP